MSRASSISPGAHYAAIRQVFACVMRHRRVKRRELQRVDLPRNDSLLVRQAQLFRTREFVRYSHRYRYAITLAQAAVPECRLISAPCHTARPIRYFQFICCCQQTRTAFDEYASVALIVYRRARHVIGGISCASIATGSSANHTPCHEEHVKPVQRPGMSPVLWNAAPIVAAGG